MLESAVSLKSGDNGEHREYEADHLVPQRVYGFNSGWKNVPDEHPALFHGVLLHRVTGEGFPDQHAFILAPGVKGTPGSADNATR